MSNAHYIVGETEEVVASIPDRCVALLLTSPPFLSLRSYLPEGHPRKDDEVGTEPTPADFLDTLLRLTAGWARVLTATGSMCVELGDTYAGGNGWATADPRASHRDDASLTVRGKKPSGGAWPEAKSLCAIPELYRVALIYGINPLTGATSPAGRWRVRNVVRWHRPNPMVGKLTDRFRNACSEVVVATRATDRWFDLDAVKVQGKSGDLVPPHDVWDIPGGNYPGSHQATYPPELCRIPILSMCPPGGLVLDPFAGSGTTGMVATGLGRDCLMIDLDERNAALARDRVGPLFLTVSDRVPPWIFGRVAA